jgi:Concanavalin A-like lectin/glucanases superfamily
MDGDYVNPAGITLEEQGALANDPDTAALFAGTPTGGLVEVLPTAPDTPLVEGGEVTLELWAKLPTDVPDWALLAGCYQPHPFPQPDTTIETGYRLRVQTGPGQIEIEANIGGMPGPLVAQVATSAAPTWHHVVLTYLNALGQEKAELYIDGQLSASTTGIFDVTTTQSFRFGGGYPGLIGEVTYPYPGLLDEVALYLNYLPQTEIEEHFITATT